MNDKLYEDCRHKEINNEGICKACGTKAAIRLPIGKNESGRLVDLSRVSDEVASKTYTQQEVDERVRLAEAAALWEACATICVNCRDRIVIDIATNKHENDRHCYAWPIRRLISPAASLALDRLIAKERLEEAEEWSRVHGLYPLTDPVCWSINRLAELRRAADVAEAPLSGEGEKG